LFEVRRDWSYITVGSLDRLPTLAPSADALMMELDRYAQARHWDSSLRGLVSHSLRIALAWIGADAAINGPLAKLVVALIAIHALGKREVTELLLVDLDLARGKLVVRRSGGRHVVHLDSVTHQFAVSWLRERHRRWPATTNPHLLVSGQTADMAGEPSVSSMVIGAVFRPLGVGPSVLRQDRILDEARHTADPVHLMRIFGISITTAMDYVYAAHPERRSTPPR
jgi:hypothetical protein